MEASEGGVFGIGLEPVYADIDLRGALDYCPWDGPLRLSRCAALHRARNGSEPSALLIELFEGLPMYAGVRITPVRREEAGQMVVSLDLQVILPE
jgi:hypothetical protein